MYPKYKKVSTVEISTLPSDGEDGDDKIEIKIVESGDEDTKQTDEKNGPPKPKSPSHYLWRTASINQSAFVNDHKEYTDSFMDFAKLRQLLNNVESNKPNATKQFLEALDIEWNKYQKFAEDEARRINQYPAEKYVISHILKYNQFICINQRMLNVILHEFDSISLHDNLCSIWEWKIKWNPQRMTFGLIKKISNLYDDERRSSEENAFDGINEFSFDRESIKFFVKRSNIMQVISIIIQHLPIYVFGDEDKKKSQRVSGQVSSVYFDNDEFKCYEERVCKEEGARAFRIRWYGEIEPGNKGDVVWMERKIHHKAMSEEGPSMKERFKMKSGKVIKFLNGSINIPNDSKDAKLQNEWIEAVNTYKLQPKTRTVCDRMSFQLSQNNDLRISLDLNLRFYREQNIKNGWFTPLDQMNDSDFSDFEFDILEIKLAGRYTDDPPDWIKDLMDSSLLEECYKFSKYGQSVNEFYSDDIDIIPAWIENVDVLNKKSENVYKQNEGVKTYKKPMEEEKVKSEALRIWRCVCFCTKEERKKKAKSVNPKTFFSNERTFLQWFKSAIFIGSAGLNIHAIDPASSAGFIMVAVALLVLCWGIVVYYVRNWKLITGQFEGLHDFYGPGFLGMVLMFVFIYGLFDTDFGRGIN